MEKKDDWHLAEKVGKLKPVGYGSDSTVFSVTKSDNANPDYAVKLYEQRNFRGIDPKDREKVLKEYYRDTQKAAEILKQNPNPLRQSIVINGRKLNLKYKVAPQGSIILEKMAERSGDSYLASFGQEFVPGLNLSILLTGSDIKQIDKNQEIFKGNAKLFEQINKLLRDLFIHLSKVLNVSLEYADLNIKPFIEDNGNLSIIITDLAGNLLNYYRYSSKF